MALFLHVEAGEAFGADVYGSRVLGTLCHFCIILCGYPLPGPSVSVVSPQALL